VAIEISEQLRSAAAYLGDSGRRWLDELPGLVASLEEAWGIVCGRALNGGNWAYVAEATTSDGRMAVLKVGIPPGDEDDDRRERRALSMMDGDPYAALLKFDDERRAMLLERLGRPLGELGLPPGRQLAIATRTAARGWRPVTGAGLRDGAAKAMWLAEFVERTWNALNEPCSEECVARALQYARNREQAVRALQRVFVHGDAHPWNVLEVPGSTLFRLIDPEGLASEPAHDLGVILRGWNDELQAGDATALAFQRVEQVGAMTGVDRQGAWEWSYIERLSSGLLLLQLGREDEARPYLEIADRFARVYTPWPQ
jgi:streptomycin 6-kinase